MHAVPTLACTRAAVSRTAPAWRWSGLLLLSVLITMTTSPDPTLARTDPDVLSRPVQLVSPGPGAMDESSILLRWTQPEAGSEYIVFLAKTSLGWGDPEALLANPEVIKHPTSKPWARLVDLHRGEEGTTSYEWAVGRRHPVSGEWILSAPASFDAVKKYEVQSGDPTPRRLVQETTRGTVAPSVSPNARQLHFVNGWRFDPVRDGEPEITPAEKAQALRPGETGSFLVQLGHPITDGERHEIEATGAQIVWYIPQYSFLVRGPAGTDAALAALPFTRWVGPYHTAYRLSPDLSQAKAGLATLVLVLFHDTDLEAAQSDLRLLGATILEASASSRYKIVKLIVDTSQMMTIAARHDVAFLEPFVQPVIGNFSVQWNVQTNILNNRRVWDMGLRGQGMVVHTADSGIRPSHNMFRHDFADSIPINDFGQYPNHRKIIAYVQAAGGVPFGDHAGASYHGSHTAGTVLGYDDPVIGSPSSGQEGMAPEAKIYFSDAGGNSTSISVPSNLNLLFTLPYTGNEGGAARLSSNSWSSPTNAYTTTAMTADEFMWDHTDFLAFFSAGNSTGPGTVGSPAVCKNGVCSGATNKGNGSTTWANFSSQGPSSDGRYKPTIVAPGSGVISAGGASNSHYQSLSGTSMSCPAKMGATALIRQYLTEGWYPSGVATPGSGFNPSGALLKAMGISSTDNDMTGFNIPNNTVGWGRINVDNILYFPGDAAVTALIDDTNGLTTGQFVEYEVSVGDNSVPLKITLCWTDIEGSLPAGVQLVNDLDLLVTDPGGLAYVGNIFAAGESAPAGAADVLNVEEGVRRNIPTLGTWTIRVTASNIPMGPQPFALAISGGLDLNSGLLKLDRASYGRQDVIEIRVEDANASSPLTVEVSSTTEPVPESVTLTGANGIFTGTINTTALTASNGDGAISLFHGDVVTVVYDDADPIASVEATAIADFEGPVITNVGSSISSNSQLITWDTDVTATSKVYYGTSPALGSETTLDPLLVDVHGMVVPDVLPQTTYYFDVESADGTGNTTRDDAGGLHYQFTTGVKGDILLVVGDDTFTDDAIYTTALDNLGWHTTVWSDGLMDNPLVGDLNTGMRSYAVVWWQVGHEQYPPFPSGAQTALATLQDGGGRLSVVSHDVAWAFADPNSGFYSVASETWMGDYLHINWLEDPLIWPTNFGIGGDPISGAYTGGVPYVAHREGASGDEVQIDAGAGTGNYVWENSDVTADNIAVRWESTSPLGNPSTAIWGGQTSKVLTNCFEFTGIVDEPTRQDIIDKSVIWLIGRDHPDVTITSPNGGEVINASPLAVTWNETLYGGTSAGSRSIYYSTDGGSSWILITASAGASPYLWDVSAIPDGSQYQVMVRVTDDGNPALTGEDDSDANFSIEGLGGDVQGPVVVAGSIKSNPNPQNNENPSTLLATVTDVGYGNSNIAAAEWFWGDVEVPAGDGTPMSGPFDQPLNDVFVTVPAGVVAPGEVKFWVRARDAAGNWGPATFQIIVVNGQPVDAVGSLPLHTMLRQNAPNPFRPQTTIQFALAEAGPVALDVYNVRGQKVRTLVSGALPAGFRSYVWDGRDDSGARAPTGVYFYRLMTSGFNDTRKMVLLR